MITPAQLRRDIDEANALSAKVFAGHESRLQFVWGNDSEDADSSPYWRAFVIIACFKVCAHLLAVAGTVRTCGNRAPPLRSFVISSPL